MDTVDLRVDADLLPHVSVVHAELCLMDYRNGEEDVKELQESVICTAEEGWRRRKEEAGRRRWVQRWSVMHTPGGSRTRDLSRVRRA